MKKRTTACPARWGAGAWLFLHYVSLAMPDRPTPADRRRMAFVFRSLGSLLACDICRRHWRELIRAHPPQTESRAALVTWLSKAHMRVNSHIPGKTARTHSMGEMMRPIMRSWRRGMRDFLFITAMCLRQSEVALFGRWCTAARRILRGEVPRVQVGSRARLLNSLCRSFETGRSKVVRKYSPWLNVKTQRAAGTRVQQLMRIVL